MSDEPRLYHDLARLWSLISPPSHYVEEAATFRARFARHGVRDGGSVLHLGCGGGSIDHNLKQWYHVTGIDRSEAMLDNARRINPEVEYIRGDMRDVRLGRTFDAVLVHDAIAYMASPAELEAAYRTAAAHLRPGGVMVALPEELRGRVQDDHVDVETTVAPDGAVTLIETRYDADPDDHTCETIYVFLIRDQNGLRVEVDRHQTGIFTLDEFLDAMRAAGFDPVAEEWELSDWTPGEELPLITAVRVR